MARCGRLANQRFRKSVVSSTFSGVFIFAYAAAKRQHRDRSWRYLISWTESIASRSTRPVNRRRWRSHSTREAKRADAAAHFLGATRAIIVFGKLRQVADSETIEDRRIEELVALRRERWPGPEPRRVLPKTSPTRATDQATSTAPWRQYRAMDPPRQPCATVAASRPRHIEFLRDAAFGASAPRPPIARVAIRAGRGQDRRTVQASPAADTVSASTRAASAYGQDRAPIHRDTQRFRTSIFTISSEPRQIVVDRFLECGIRCRQVRRTTRRRLMGYLDDLRGAPVDAFENLAREDAQILTASRRGPLPLTLRVPSIRYADVAAANRAKTSATHVASRPSPS